MKKKRLAKNLFVIALVEIINKAVPLILLYLVPKRLGLAGFGFAQIGLTLIETAIPFITFGYQYIAAQEVGRNAENKVYIGSLSSSLISLRAIQALLTYIFLLLFCWFSPHYIEYVPFISFWGLVLFTSSLEMIYVQMGVQKYHWNMIVQGLAKILGLFCIFVFVHDAKDLMLYGFLSLLPNMLISIVSVFLSQSSLRWSKPRWDLMQMLFNKGSTLALVFVTLTLFERIDVLLVGRIFDLESAGIYAGASRLGQALSQSLIAITNLFYSELVSIFDKKKITEHIELGLFILTALMFPIMVGIHFVDNEILSFMLTSGASNQGNILSGVVWGVFFYGIILSLGLQVLVLSQKIKILAYILLGGSLLQTCFCYLASLHSMNAVVFASILAKALTAFFVYRAATQNLHSLHWTPIFKNALAASVMLVCLLCFRGIKIFENTIVQSIVIAAPVYILILLLLNHQWAFQVWKKLR